MSFITLDNQYVNPVVWGDGKLCDFTVANHVDIWQINISSKLPVINHFLSVLTPDEISRANKYLRGADSNRFIISRGSLRYILSLYLKQPAQSIRFELEENNKPYIAHRSLSRLHFNLSDSADKVLIAIAGSPVGIDVELIKPDFSYHALLKNNFSLPEGAYIKQHDSYNRFFLLWTRKEAILKATGIGLTDHLKLIPSLDDRHLIDGSLLSTETHWRLNSFNPDDNYIATIAAATSLNSFRFYNFDAG